MNQDPRKIMLPASYPKRTVDELLEAMLTYIDKAFRNLENKQHPDASHLNEVGRLVTMATQLKTGLSKGDKDKDPSSMSDEQLRDFVANDNK